MAGITACPNGANRSETGAGPPGWRGRQRSDCFNRSQSA
jgi:hypothetical protein